MLTESCVMFFSPSHAVLSAISRDEYLTSAVSPFLAWGDFHARSRFARSTIPEEKWGTTRSLTQL